MAEGGVVGRLVGGEEAEEVGGEAPCPPLADAVAMDLAGDTAEARLYLRDARRLILIQTEHLHEQREVQLSHLKLRRFIDRLKAGTQMLIVLVASAIACMFVVLLTDAVTSRSVVVDAFDAPAALAGRGVTGEVVAAEVLDGLQRLQLATRGPVLGLSARNAWSSDIKAEVPDTGVSVGEISRLLHDRFGHDLHIGGALVQTAAGGLALTVRGDGVPAATFEGAAGELDRLAVRAAEHVYGRSQPVPYLTYLEGSGRDRDALAFAPGAFSRATDDMQRAKIANDWGNALNDLSEALAAAQKYQLVMALVPPRSRYYWTAWANLVNSTWVAGGEEAGRREGDALLAAAAAARGGDRPALRFFGNSAQVAWDLPLMLRSYLADLAARGGGTTVIDGPSIADAYALMHDPVQAARYLAASDPDDSSTVAEAGVLAGMAALERGDAAGAVASLQAFDRVWLATTDLQSDKTDQPCLLGLALGLAGRADEAAAAFGQVRQPFSRCYGYRGYALAQAGDVAGARRVWAEGVRLLPDLPFVRLERGLWEMETGDLADAAADFAAAAAASPRLADPWKAWGDLLAREGHRREAVAKYDVALTSAPAWAGLRQAREAAVRGVGSGQ